MSFRINLLDNDSPSPASAPRRIELQRRDGRRVPLAAELETVLQERTTDIADPIAALRGSGRGQALTVRLL